VVSFTMVKTSIILAVIILVLACATTQAVKQYRLYVVHRDLASIDYARNYLQEYAFREINVKEPVTLRMLNRALGIGVLNDRQLHEDFSRAGLTLVSYGKFFSDKPLVLDAKTGAIAHPETGLNLPGYHDPVQSVGIGAFVGGHVRAGFY